MAFRSDKFPLFTHNLIHSHMSVMISMNFTITSPLCFCFVPLSSSIFTTRFPSHPVLLSSSFIFLSFFLVPLDVSRKNNLKNYPFDAWLAHYSSLWPGGRRLKFIYIYLALTELIRRSGGQKSSNNPAAKENAKAKTLFSEILYSGISRTSNWKYCALLTITD